MLRGNRKRSPGKKSKPESSVKPLPFDYYSPVDADLTSGDESHRVVPAPEEASGLRKLVLLRHGRNMSDESLDNFKVWEDGDDVEFKLTRRKSLDEIARPRPHVKSKENLSSSHIRGKAGEKGRKEGGKGTHQRQWFTRLQLPLWGDLKWPNVLPKCLSSKKTTKVEVDVSSASTVAQPNQRSTVRSKKITVKSVSSATWSCLDRCCWLVGNICVFWGLILLLYFALPHNHIQAKLNEALGVLPPSYPALKLLKEGTRVVHPWMLQPLNPETCPVQPSECSLNPRECPRSFSPNLEGLNPKINQCVSCQGEDAGLNPSGENEADLKSVGEDLVCKRASAGEDSGSKAQRKSSGFKPKPADENFGFKPNYHPVVFVPGIVTAGLELWEGKSCAEGLFRKRLWGGTFGEVYKRPLCWVEHILLDNETGMDPPGIRLRPVTGLVAADYFMPGYFVWAVMIEQLSKLGFDERNLYMASYDWRLSFLNTEKRDASLTRLKLSIETLVKTNYGQKVVVIPHSMGALYFLFFMKWVEADPPMGGGGGPSWISRHIRSVLNIGPPFLGVPKAVTGLFSAEDKDIAVFREVAPVVVDISQTIQHVMRVTRTWDSTMSMLPKGGSKVWGNASWSPEGAFNCSNWMREREKRREVGSAATAMAWAAATAANNFQLNAAMNATLLGAWRDATLLGRARESPGERLGSKGENPGLNGDKESAQADFLASQDIGSEFRSEIKIPEDSGALSSEALGAVGPLLVAEALGSKVQGLGTYGSEIGTDLGLLGKGIYGPISPTVPLKLNSFPSSLLPGFCGYYERKEERGGGGEVRDVNSALDGSEAATCPVLDHSFSLLLPLFFSSSHRPSQPFYSPERGEESRGDKEGGGGKGEWWGGDPEKKSGIVYYGRLVSFSKDAATLPLSELLRRRRERRETRREEERAGQTEGMEGEGRDEIDASLPAVKRNLSCGEVYTEYHDMSWQGVKDIADGEFYIAGNERKESEKESTTGTINSADVAKSADVEIVCDNEKATDWNIVDVTRSPRCADVASDADSAADMAWTADVFNMLTTVAPKLMKRARKNWSYGIADVKSAEVAKEEQRGSEGNEGDRGEQEGGVQRELEGGGKERAARWKGWEKYDHPKFWANPLETQLPDAPDLEMFCMYGVGLLTERAYVYTVSPYNATCLIPFRIDSSANSGQSGDANDCLVSGTLFTDGDETVPVISAGLPCAKLWKGRTRFNPSGLKTFVREYAHSPPLSLLEGRGSLSGSHVDIMGNSALIEDVLRIVMGATGDSLGGDRIASDLEKWADSVDIDLS